MHRILNFVKLTGLLGALFVLSGCIQPNGLSFATVGSPSRSHNTGLTTLRFASENVILSAPTGFCFDRETLEETQAQGFAVLARCSVIETNTRPRSARDIGLITATIAPLAEGQAAPDLAALKAAIPQGKIVSARADLALPLVQVKAQAAHPIAASKTHWRGVFAQHGHMIALTLYAPDRGHLLTRKGAVLLSEMAQRSNARALEQDVVDLIAQQNAHPAQAPVLRPRLRPGLSKLSPGT